MPFLYLPGMMRSRTPLWRRIFARKAPGTAQPADLAASLAALAKALVGHGAGRKPEVSPAAEPVAVATTPATERP